MLKNHRLQVGEIGVGSVLRSLRRGGVAKMPSLIHDEHAHAVGGVVELVAERVVRSAIRVRAHRFQLLNAPSWWLAAP